MYLSVVIPRAVAFLRATVGQLEWRRRVVATYEAWEPWFMQRIGVAATAVGLGLGVAHLLTAAFGLAAFGTVLWAATFVGRHSAAPRSVLRTTYEPTSTVKIERKKSYIES